MPACCCPQYFFLRTAFHFFMINGKFGLEWKRFSGGSALVLNPRKMSMTDGLSDCPEEGVQASGTAAMCVSAWGWQSCLRLPGGWRHPSLDSPVVELWPCYLLGEQKDSNDVPWTELLTALSFFFFFLSEKCLFQEFVTCSAFCVFTSPIPCSSPSSWYSLKLTMLGTLWSSSYSLCGLYIWRFHSQPTLNLSVSVIFLHHGTRSWASPLVAGCVYMYIYIYIICPLGLPVPSL